VASVAGSTSTTKVLKQYPVPETRGLLPHEKDQFRGLFESHKRKELAIPEKRIEFEVLSIDKMAMYANFPLSQEFKSELQNAFFPEPIPLIDFIP
jgi:hypothetical protein